MYIGINTAINVYKGCIKEYTMMLTHLPRVGRVFHQPRLQLVELLPHFGRTRFVDRLIDATIGVGEVVDRPAYHVVSRSCVFRVFRGVFRGGLGVYMWCIYMYNGCT